jgi:two-component system chemotaxis sensor kinase CheA
MRIADVELRDLFQAESEEHLQTLEQGLLHLESEPQDSQTLDEVFRAAHSLKGAARMLEVAKVEALAHRFEDLLGTARHGTVQLTAEAVDRLYHALDSMRAFCVEAVTGQPCEIDVASVLDQLSGEAGGKLFQSAAGESASEAADDFNAAPPGAALAEHAESPAIVETAVEEHAAVEPAMDESSVTFGTAAELVEEPPPPTPPAAVAPPAKEDVERGGASAEKPPQARAYAIDTIRVASSKLDALMSQAGELMVTRGRIAHRVGQVEQLMAAWEEWKQDAYAVRATAGPDAEGNVVSGEQIGQYVQRDRRRREQIGSLLKELETAAKADDTRFDLLASQLEEDIRSIRLLPLSSIFNLFPRMVRDLARDQEKEVAFTIEGGETSADKRILEEIKDPLTHMIRNAIDHGIELPDQREQAGKPREATVVLRAYQSGAHVMIEVQDDGAGIDAEQVKQAALKRRVATAEELAEMTEMQIRLLIFAAGFSTKSMVTDVSGRGVGMDVVRANVDRLRGEIEVKSEVGQGTLFRLIFPLTLATRRVLIVAVEDQKFAIPVEHVQTTRLVSPDEVFGMQGHDTIVLDNEPLSVARLSEMLELAQQETPGGGQAFSATDAAASPHVPSRQQLACIILHVEGERSGFLVDKLLDEQEVVVKSHGPVLRRVRNVSGSTILQTGEVCVTLNAHDLVKSMRIKSGRGRQASVLEEEKRQRVILLAEDSIVTRTQEKRILNSAGYEVVTAVDGQDAYNKLATRQFDLVVSDVEMPNLDGLSLTKKIRQQVQYKQLPVILVTSLASDEDRKRGMEVGADAYLTKPGFDQTVFLETVRRFV